MHRPLRTALAFRPPVPSRRALLWTARVGYAARGVLYGTLGALGAAAALELRDEPPSLGDALAAFLGLSWGPVLLAAVAAGLAAFAAWRLLQAWLDLPDAGDGLYGAVFRLGSLASAAAHGALAVTAGMLAGAWLDAGSGGDLVREASEEAMEVPFGRLLVGAAGLLSAANGVGQFAKARGPAFREIRADGLLMAAVRVAGLVGIAAKGTAFLVVGWLLLRAAWRARSREAGGLGRVFDALGATSLDPALPVALGTGFILYGVFNVAKAWLHRLPDPQGPARRRREPRSASR